MPIRKIIKKTIKTIGRKKRGRPTDEDRRYEAISEDVEDYSRSRKADIEQKRKLRKKAAGGIIKKGIKAISKKKKGRPKSKEGPTKKVFVNKPITPTNQQSLLKQYKTVKDSFDKQQGIMKSIRERGDKPITDGQRKSTESFIRTMIFGSPAKGPTIVRITKDSIRKAYKKGNERLRELGREIDKGQSIRSKMQKKSKVSAGTDTLYYKKGTGKSTIKKPRGFGAARYNKRRK
jgi:hypothetical protein